MPASQEKDNIMEVEEEALPESDVGKSVDNLRQMFAQSVTTVMDSKDRSHLKVLLECLSSGCSEYPEVFVQLPHAGLSPEQLESKQKLCRAFTRWILGCMLSLLGYTQSRLAYDDSVRLQGKILRLILTYDPSWYSELVMLYVRALNELQSMADALASETETNFTLTQFQVQPDDLKDLKLEAQPIKFTRISSCIKTQEAMLQVLAEGVEGSKGYCDLTLHNIWDTLCNLLLEGSFGVKGEALRCMACFLKSVGPSRHIKTQTHFIECLETLLDFVTSRDLTSPTVLQEDLKLFEKIFCGFLRELALCVDTFDPLCQDYFLKVASKYVSRLPERSDELQVAVCVAISELVQRSSFPSCVTELASNVGPILMSNMGKLEAYGDLLSEIVAKEIANELADKKHVDMTVFVSEVSPIWKLVVVIFQDLEKSTSDNLMDKLDHIQAVLRCAATSHGRVGDEIVNFFTPEHIHHWLQSCIKTIIAALPDLHIAKKILNHVLQGCCHLIQASALQEDLSQNICVAFLTLPWMAVEMKWLDLKLGDNQADFAKISAACYLEIDVALKVEGLDLMCLFPKEVAHGWRMRVLKAAASEADPMVIAQIIQCIPFALHFGGSSSAHLIGDVLHPAIEEGKFLMNIAGILPNLICIISKTTRVTRTFQSGEVSTFLTCDECKTASAMVTFATSQHDFAALVPIIMKLLSRPEPDVRSKVTDCLVPIAAHGLALPGSSLEAILQDLTKSPEELRQKVLGKIRMLIIHEIKAGKLDGEKSVVIQSLGKEMKSAMKKQDVMLVLEFMAAIKDIGQIPVEGVQLPVLYLLLTVLTLPSPIIQSTAMDHAREISKSHKITPPELLAQYKPQVCCFIVETMVKLLPKGKDAVTNYLCASSSVLGVRGVHTFLSHHIHHILPHLVPLVATQSEVAPMMDLLSDLLNVSIRNILTDQFQYLYPHLLLNRNKSTVRKCLEYVEKVTEINARNLRRSSLQMICNQLLLHYAENSSKVLRAVGDLAGEDDDYSGKKHDMKLEDIAAYINHRFLGVLVYLDNKLLAMAVKVESKQLVLRSLKEVMKLMGSKYLTRVRLKVFTTLKTALSLKHEGLMKDSCEAWEAFVKNVHIQSLGPLLNQIVVTLLPLLNQRPAQAWEILHHLIIDNKHAMAQYFSEIHYMPEVPELQDINMLLKSHSEVSSQSDLKTVLNHAIKCISHENVEVRQHALNKLKALLQSSSDGLHNLILGSESMDPIVTKLVDELMSGCRDNDESVRLLCGECLGEIGAIDPGRLGIVNDFTVELAKVHTSVETNDFAFDLILELARSFLAAGNTQDFDCCSLTLQDILKIYEIQGPSGPPSKVELWNRFPDYVQEILHPLLTSRYKLVNQSRSKKLISPIYRSKLGASFNQWATEWAGILSDKVQTKVAHQVFKVCSPTMKRDIRIVLYLLPYIVVSILTDRDESNKGQVLEEIMAVLKGGATQLDSPEQDQLELQHMSCQTVFSIMDHLGKWKRKHYAQKRMALKSATIAEAPYRRVSDFLRSIPQDLLAQASFQCNAFSRALMHCESYIKGDPSQLQGQLDFLQRVYVALDDPDAVSGIMALREKEATLEEQIVTYEATGRLQDAMACYERITRGKGCPQIYFQGMLRCYLALDQPHSALALANGLMAQRPEWKDDVNEYRVEACWQLAQWEELESLVDTPSRSGAWGVGVGQAMLAARKGQKDQVEQVLQSLRRQQIAPLSAASMEQGSYRRAYQYILRLHMLAELEQALCLCCDGMDASGANFQSLLTSWQRRLQFSQCSLRTFEPLLSLQRVMLQFLINNVRGIQPDAVEKIRREIGKSWLHSAQVARKANHLQRAHSMLLDAGPYDLSAGFLELAKWQWCKGEQDQAITTLKRGIGTRFKDLTGSTSKGRLGSYSEQALECAKARLLLAKYSDETSSVDVDTNVKNYTSAAETCREWEDGLFHLAHYYDRISTSTEDEANRSEIQVHVVKYYGKSLQYGCNFIYQSMPRLLSIWLDTGSQIDKVSNSKLGDKSELKSKVAKMTQQVAHLADILSPYKFMTAFPQLISRICHSCPEVYAQLKAIIVKILVTYPQQSLWMMMGVSKSSYAMRQNRCMDMFAEARQSGELGKYITDATTLAKHLLDLCNRKVEAGRPTVALIQLDRNFPRLLDNPNFSKILLPCHSLLTVTLPPVSNPATSSSHNPFPHPAIYAEGVSPTVEVMPSLQKPKKVTFTGSDGRKYSYLCKPKDDLRKDCRLMEFNDVINRYLLKDAESRRRSLHIRTYSVVPLNEECGLIEWVNNLTGLRQILFKTYKEKGMYVGPKELKEMMCGIKDSLDKKRQMFTTRLLVRHPAVFSEWFHETFPDPQSWYMARLAYTQTTAVISMVGYILGLGDRHGENVLFDSSCGDTVHVDFNCLFNKGETFDWPERVPFRLTHNMIEAMGATGYEGTFRRCCEVAMRVMRSHTPTLMSFLRPFIHDPLVEWKGKTGRNDSGEISNEKAVEHVKNIERRLLGLMKNRYQSESTPLSVEGQVNWLITEATSVENLSQMYIGWAAYM